MTRPTDIEAYTLLQWEALSEWIFTHQARKALQLIMVAETPFIRKGVFTSFMKRFSTHPLQHVQIDPTSAYSSEQLSYQLEKTFKHSTNRILVRHLLNPIPRLLFFQLDGEASLSETLPPIQAWGQQGISINVIWTDFLGLALLQESGLSDSQDIHISYFFDQRLQYDIPTDKLSALGLGSEESSLDAMSYTYLEDLLILSPESANQFTQQLGSRRSADPEKTYLMGELAFRQGHYQEVVNAYTGLCSEPPSNFSAEKVREIHHRIANSLLALTKGQEVSAYIQQIGNSQKDEKNYLAATETYYQWGTLLAERGWKAEGVQLLEEGISTIAYTDSPLLELQLHEALIKAHREDEEKRSYHQQIATQLSQQHNLPLASRQTPKTIKQEKSSKKVAEQENLNRRGFLGKFFRLNKED